MYLPWKFSIDYLRVHFSDGLIVNGLTGNIFAQRLNLSIQVITGHLPCSSAQKVLNHAESKKQNMLRNPVMSVSNNEKGLCNTANIPFPP